MKDTQRVGATDRALMKAILGQGNRAHGRAIYQEANATHASVPYGAVYVKLEGLERRGFVACSPGDPIPERGGISRRYFSLTEAGRAALRAESEEPAS